LGQFLAAHRARVGPELLGLPVHGRRRTVGLRREEVAALAGVSVDYYTRLEQGRDRTPSPPIVAALGRALRLDRAETAHLHWLAGHAAPPEHTPTRSVSVATTALLEALHPTPAWVLNPALDILAWNPAMALTVTDPAQLPLPHRNVAWLLFCTTLGRQLFEEWTSVTAEVVGLLRNAAAHHPDDARTTAVIADLTVASADFGQLWRDHRVHDTCTGIKILNHVRAGRLTLHYQSLRIEGGGNSLVTYVPADAASGHALATLTSEGTASPRRPSDGPRSLHVVPAYGGVGEASTDQDNTA
jgi:transcriptional regulator with XRE-family HTH domain